MNTIKEKIKSLKAMMASFGVALSDIVENEELLGLLRLRLQNGEISEQEVLNLVKNLPVNRNASKPGKQISMKMLHFATHGATGIEYALNGGDVIGPVIQDKNIRYVLSLKNSAKNLNLNEAEELARNQENIRGIAWIVPNDDHFRALIGNLDKVNKFLEAYGGDKITSVPFLSATSQSYPPKQWNVRLILPLPK